MMACIETLALIGYIADVYTVLSIPYIIRKSIQWRKQKHLYEQLQLKVFEEKGRNIANNLSKKTNKKKDWYLGGGEAVLKPVREFLLDSVQYVPLLSDEMKYQHKQITKKVCNTDVWTNYPKLAEEVLEYLYAISAYVSTETQVQ